MPCTTKKKILITGATGFIGKYIIEEALLNDFEIYIALRETSDTSKINHLNFNKIKVDFSSYKTIESSFSSNITFDTVVHNAGVKSCIVENDFNKYNVELTKNLCTVLKKKNLLKGMFIYMSSLAALGPGSEAFEDITENKKKKPISNYGLSKSLAENEVVTSGLDYVILRPTAVYGKGTSDYDSLLKIVKKRCAIYMTDPNQHLSFVHANDVAKVIFIANCEKSKNQIFNVSDGVDYTLASVYEIIASAFGLTLKYKFKIPFILVLTIAQINHCLKRFYNIDNSLLGREKALEVTASNWKCSAKKLMNDINFKPSHSLQEIVQ